MLQSWHIEDIRESLERRRWRFKQERPKSPDGSYYAGPSMEFERGSSVLTVTIMCDIGEPYSNAIAEVAGAFLSDRKAGELWLHRTRSSRWRKELYAWADTVSAADE